VVVGTTDTPVDAPSLEPVPLAEEVDFILEHARRYLERDPERSDVLSVFAGLRPLVAADDASGGTGDTSQVSREHVIRVSGSGLLTIAGGKWTTYRKMAEDTVDAAAALGDLPPEECVTRELAIHGFHRHSDRFGELAPYGSDAPAVKGLMAAEPDGGTALHPRLGLRRGEVMWAARREMARTVDDVLARRSRALLLDARAATEAAPAVARILARELGRDGAWERAQVEAFEAVAAGYVV
jgi:glycerol-3-phosphate dehydrogenase